MAEEVTAILQHGCKASYKQENPTCPRTGQIKSGVGTTKASFSGDSAIAWDKRQLECPIFPTYI